jgi:hypothetical protein
MIQTEPSLKPEHFNADCFERDDLLWEGFSAWHRHLEVGKHSVTASA